MALVWHEKASRTALQTSTLNWQTLFWYRHTHTWRFRPLYKSDQETIHRNAQLRYTHIVYCTLWEECKQTQCPRPPQQLGGKDHSSDNQKHLLTYQVIVNTNLSFIYNFWLSVQHDMAVPGKYISWIWLPSNYQNLYIHDFPTRHKQKSHKYLFFEHLVH